MLALGSTLKHRKTKVVWRVAAVDGADYVLAPHEEFGQNWAASADELKEHFGAVVPPPEPGGADSRNAWQRLSDRAAALAGVRKRPLLAVSPEDVFRTSADAAALDVARRIYANPEQRAAAQIDVLPMSAEVAAAFDRLDSSDGADAS